MSDSTPSFILPADPLLWHSLVALSLLGLIMLTSTTAHLSETAHGTPLYFFIRQGVFVLLGGGLGLAVLQIPLEQWRDWSVPLLFVGILLLIVVLIPGIGHAVNGSMRWFNVGGLRFQPSEAMKLLMIIFLAGYLVRRGDEVRQSISGTLKPLALLVLVTGLLLLEPDYGATVVLFATVLGMIFVAGLPWWQFFLWLSLVSGALAALMVLAPYRIQRLTAFLDPWADPFNSGFQLTQALIAIGRGEWFGVGLGNSVQKLTYLPEAHTDFLFAIIAEELGLAGMIVVITLFALIVLRAFHIARQAERREACFEAYVAYGIGLCIGLQATINLGVNMGLLPTKGLTLPLMSYGGSSMLITALMLALLLRVDVENRLSAKDLKP
jgi:cell division protein FtsW